MQVINIQSVNFSSAFGIKMATIINLHKNNSLNGSYGIISPGGETTPHKHDETEVFVILSGTGEIVADGEYYPVCSGDIIIIEPFDSHVLRNTSNQDLCFTDFYWRSTSSKIPVKKNYRPVFVFSTPPTPNGDLHLGHLSGPYLGADVYVRYLRLTGTQAYHLTGSDDFQSYVVSRAQQEKLTPEETASKYATEIISTLNMMDIYPDQYTLTSKDASYKKGLRLFFSRLVNSGISQIKTPALFDSENNEYLYEADVKGNCPSCQSSCNGNICEECGEPNTCIELSSPQSKITNTPPYIKKIKRYGIYLNQFKNIVQMHHKRGKISPKLQRLAEKILSRKKFFLPITHPANWGVSPIESTEGQQVIWVWPEMAYGFLHGISKLGERLNKNWHANQPQENWKIVHFFGYDNSFYHTVLYPILYHLAFPQWRCDIDYHVNEFYLLDSLKFSTSRRHAIWGKDILSKDTVDAVRYYLALTRSEHKRTNFTLENFYNCVDQILINQWQRWLNNLGDRICHDFNGQAPDAGSWTPTQISYLKHLENHLICIKQYYNDGSSLNEVANELNNLVKSAIQFSQSYQQIRGVNAVHDEYRTAIALELASARLLAQVSAPLMPRFSSRLNKALFQSQSEDWPSSVNLITAGTAINLSNQIFFISIKNKENKS